MSAHSPSHSHAAKPDLAPLLAMVTEQARLRGERMTDLRREVLTALTALDHPLTAYQLLDRMNKKRKPRLTAMSLYRTLDFLITLGTVIKLESTNTYKLCGAHDEAHSHLLFVCNQCGATDEVDDRATAEQLIRLGRKHGHTLTHNVVELPSLCENCA